LKPKKPIVKKSIKQWLRRILITLAIIILLPIGLFTIGWLNRDTVIERLQDWYSENNTGTLTIGKVNASFFSGFPNVGFTLIDIRQSNTDTITDQFSTLYIKQAKVVIGAGNLLRGDIKFENIVIKNAIITSEVISKKSLEYHEKLKSDEQFKKRKKLKLPEWLHEERASFLLENVTYISKDSILNKHYNFQIHEVEGVYKGTELKLNGNVYLDVTVNNLGFNTAKGSFSNGARFIGRPKFTIDFKNDIIDFPEFPLHIDEQNFKLKANLNLSESSAYSFNFENPQTDFKAVKGLLNNRLAAKIKNYEILKPFKSNVQITGTFDYGGDPDIVATFSTINNELIIAEKFHLENTTFSGYLTTDVYTTDKLGKSKKSPKGIKIAFNTINTKLDDIKVEITNGYYQSTPENSNFVEATLQLEGSNQSLSKIIETDNFDFKGGNFQLGAIISGDIPNPYQFLNVTTGNFYLSNTQVILKKNGLQLPIQNINLELKRENSFLRQLAINLPNGENLVLKGQLKNISGLLSKEPTIPTTSQIYLDSNNLNINEVLAMAKRFIPNSDAELDDRKTLHETLEAIYSQFHPQFGINVDNLQYKDYIINDLKSNIALVNSETILLRNFDFKYREALTNLKGKIIVHGPESKLKDAIYMNAEAISSGSISIFENLFNIELFRIDSGEFQFHGNVTGNVKEFSELLNNARGDLTLTNTKLFYEPAEMDIEIDSLALFVDNSDILLKKFSLEVGELYPINLSGSIKQYPSFLLDDIQESGSIYLKIAAPFVDGDNLLTTINSFENKEKINTTSNEKALHTIFKDINKFNPEMELSIDSLKYKDLITEDIKALMYFENDSILKLNHLNLSYKETNANVNGTINAHTSRQDLSKGNPFDLDFSVSVEGKSEDLNDYLKTTNFIFTSGDFEFKGNYNAQAEELDIMNSKTIGDLKIRNTQIDYRAGNLLIPVDSLHVEIYDDLATLKTLDIDLPGKSSVYFSGSIDNFSDFINGSIENSLHSSNFAIKSPYLATTDIKAFLKNSTLNTQKTDTEKFNLEKFKQALIGFNTSFYPSISIAIDTLSHNQLDLTNFGLDLYYGLDSNLKMEDTRFKFYGGSILMSIDVDLANEVNTPVTINMQASDINIHELVTRFDYFNNEDLKKTEKIEGNLNFSIDAIGTLDFDGKVNMGSLNGIFQLEIQDLALFNYKPIMDKSIMMKNERFKNLQFRPIVQTFEIRDGILIIPRTEIQSSAIHLFVEGNLKFDEYINIWLSIPYKNFKANDGLTLPEKTTYQFAGSKFYVQLLQDKMSNKKKKQKLNVKVRISNRKLKKQK
jgi:hypothetical protein